MKTDAETQAKRISRTYRLPDVTVSRLKRFLSGQKLASNETRVVEVAINEFLDREEAASRRAAR